MHASPPENITDGYIVDYRCSSLPEDQVIILGCNVVADLKH